MPAFHFNVRPAVCYSPHASGLPLPSGLGNWGMNKEFRNDFLALGLNPRRGKK